MTKLPAPIKPTVTLEDLEKLDVRVGTIERVEDVSRSNKLVKLSVSFGDHTRNILVGMGGSVPTQPRSWANRHCLS